MTAADLVSVVVPAFNAEATLAATIDSVRRQSYDPLEIVIVDDGSTDGTLAIARSAALEDARIRVISMPNGGVAKARNAGVAASCGPFVAPVDADDLWHPDKIAKQVLVMRRGGPQMGFVYTLYRRIDQGDRILNSNANLRIEGHVFLRLLLVNFVANGSSLLIRREAFEAVGGYEFDLHAQGAQGCEDYLLQMLIARQWTVGLAAEYLTGYRITEGAMSVDAERMKRSHILALQHVRRRFPEAPVDLVDASGAMAFARLATHRLLRERRPFAAARDIGTAVGIDTRVALQEATHTILKSVRTLLSHPFGRHHWRKDETCRFFEADPRVGPTRYQILPLQGRGRMRFLATQEEAFFRVCADSPAGASVGTALVVEPQARGLRSVEH